MNNSAVPLENKDQQKVIKQLSDTFRTKYNFKYIGNLKDEECSNLREDTLRKFLKDNQKLTPFPDRRGYHIAKG